MIVPMQHITLLSLADEREQALAALAEIGVLHTVEPENVREQADIKTLESERERAHSTIEHIATLQDGKEHIELSTDPAALSLDSLVETYEKLVKLRKQIETQRHHLTPWLPFGHFDPSDIRRLHDAGLTVRLFHAPIEAAPTTDKERTVRILRRSEAHVWGIQIGAADLPEACTEIPLPEKPTHKLVDEIEASEAEARELEASLHAAHRHLPDLRAKLTERDDDTALARALAAMREQGAVAWLTGFCPVKRVGELRAEARRRGWGLVCRDPHPGEAVPTLITRPRWLAPIKAVFDLLGIHPGYREADISWAFLFFLTLFFALLIGDAGYGAVILAATILARLRLPRAPLYPFAMLGLLGSGTMVWGALTGNWFGIPPESLPTFMRPGETLHSLRDDRTIMQLCFTIGAVHLSLAHIWNSILLWPSPRVLSQMGWIILIWSMYAIACLMVLDMHLVATPVLLAGFGTGLLLVVAFMTPPSEFSARWIDHAMLPLSLAGCLVDVISYVRLYAVGVATLQVAQSFNNMALGIDLPILLRLPLVALVLLFGHALNMALGGLSILVHGIRLNTLEFSQHKGLEWAGFAYTPLQRHRESGSTV